MAPRHTVLGRQIANAIVTPHQPSRCLVRSMATEAPLPTSAITSAYMHAHNIPPLVPHQQYTPPPNPFQQPAILTLHAFPSFEPTQLVTYPGTHLMLPLRKDILHRAVIFEGDMTRQGTASTKWRSEVHGSGRKVRPQKGTGKARLGDKKSPMLRGGGVAFGPKPRDFSTRLPRKIYHQAWRTALSYRYAKGELIVVDDDLNLPDVHEDSAARYMRDLLKWNRMGHSDGRTLFISLERREALFDAFGLENSTRDGRALEAWDVDVKDLLELGRIVVERSALEWMFRHYEGDLPKREQWAAWSRGTAVEAASNAPMLTVS